MASRLRVDGTRENTLKNICKSIAAVTFLALTSLPATAQLQVRFDVPLPGLEIRVGHTAPPRLRSERKPSRPGRDFLWVKGSWDWQANDWAWIPGRWERPNEHGARWMKARYVREGPAWRYEPAHWSNQHLLEGDDYRRWKAEYRADRKRRHDHDGNHVNH